mmetsp:Transcript_7161/g.23747  ORF Transcript_7161/g.23747 Transcript_7161/m.23747 type:complete len:249 (+) Transcript_7161:52-798(+)
MRKEACALLVCLAFLAVEDSHARVGGPKHRNAEDVKVKLMKQQHEDEVRALERAMSEERGQLTALGSVIKRNLDAHNRYNTDTPMGRFGLMLDAGFVSSHECLPERVDAAAVAQMGSKNYADTPCIDAKFSEYKALEAELEEAEEGSAGSAAPAGGGEPAQPWLEHNGVYAAAGDPTLRAQQSSLESFVRDQCRECPPVWTHILSAVAGAMAWTVCSKAYEKFLPAYRLAMVQGKLEQLRRAQESIAS